MRNLIDMTGFSSGTIKVGEIIQSQPRRYSARCNHCGTTFAQDHLSLRTRIDANLPLECPNSACRRGALGAIEREREYFRQLRRTERQRDIAAAEEQMRKRYAPSAGGEHDQP